MIIPFTFTNDGPVLLLKEAINEEVKQALLKHL